MFSGAANALWVKVMEESLKLDFLRVQSWPIKKPDDLNKFLNKAYFNRESILVCLGTKSVTASYQGLDSHNSKPAVKLNNA